MFEKYTEGARRSIFFARDEAFKRDARSIAPEHLLLVMLRAESEIIQRLSPSRESSIALQREIIAVLPPEGQNALSNELPLSAEVKQALHRAHEASLEMQHWHIGVEHLLLGLFGEGQRYQERIDCKLDIRHFLSERGYDRQRIEEKIRSGVTSA